MKIKPYEETHMDGIISLENNPFDNILVPPPNPFRTQPYITGDFGIQIAEDGRIWICINGISFVRFTPTKKYHTVGSKLNPTEEVFT